MFTVKKDQKRKRRNVKALERKQKNKQKTLSLSPGIIIVFRENPEEFHIHAIGMCISFVVT